MDSYCLVLLVQQTGFNLIYKIGALLQESYCKEYETYNNIKSDCSVVNVEFYLYLCTQNFQLHANG